MQHFQRDDFFLPIRRRAFSGPVFVITQALPPPHATAMLMGSIPHGTLSVAREQIIAAEGAQRRIHGRQFISQEDKMSKFQRWDVSARRS